VDVILSSLQPGMPIVYGGNRVTQVDDDLAAAFVEGDRLVVVQDTGDLLHIPGGEWETAGAAIDAAVAAFSAMGGVTRGQLTTFYEAFAGYLSDDDSFAPIREANDADVAAAADKGRSTTRLALGDAMRQDMVNGLLQWVGAIGIRDASIRRVEHDGWFLDLVRSGLGVVGFVFEGRPNVFADATGVLAGGNTVVFRIGSDALGTARAIMDHALVPALNDAGMPSGAVSLVDSPSRAAGWAMFSDPRLGLAVARGSGRAVSQLGAVARQTGTPVSLHGTGGAWIVAAESAEAWEFGAAVFNSLDRKVCNTLNTVCIVASRSEDLVPEFLQALHRAGEHREATSKLHITESARAFVPDEWFEDAQIVRASGTVTEPRTEVIGDDQLGVEWEWEESPEVTLTIVPDVETAIRLFNEQSPRFGASLVSEDSDEHRRFFDLIDAPFVGTGFTRWVDGQYALNTPELGLSNWQYGRLFGRGGILSGDSIYTIRVRARQTDPDLGRWQL
jgi:glutamate-5-semialdehyde dehydrogenase